MFRFMNTVCSKMTRSRMALAAAPVALAGLAAPMMGAGPWDWKIGSHDRHDTRRIEVVVRPETRPVVVVRQIEVEPFDLHLTAYQSRDTIMVFASGNNRTGGYTTSLRAIGGRENSTRIQLSNITSGGICTQAITSFSLNAAMHVDCAVSSIEVRVADRVICVPVTQVASIS